MIRALYISENALMDQQTGVDTISNNIANLNTVGYKKSRTLFADLLYQNVKSATTTTDPEQVGLGSKLDATDMILTQGDLVPTEKQTDVAIEGNGFFTFLDPESKNGGFLFSRAGDFSFDADYNLVNPDGYKVVGWLSEPSSTGEGFKLPTDPTTGLPVGNVQPINLTNYQTVPAVASTYIRFKANLNSGSSVKEYKPADADKNFDILFDSNGDSLNVQDGDNFQVSFDNGKTWHTYEYDSDGNVSDGAEGFTTLGDLVNLFNQDMKADGVNATATIENGSIKITNNDSTNDLVIRVRPTSEDPNFPNPKENQKLTTIITNLNQLIPPGGEASTQQVNVASHVIESYFYDSTGEKHKIDITFEKIGVNKWSYNITMPDNDGTVENGTGTITFDADGGLSKDTKSPTITVNLKNGAPPVNLLINFWNTDSGSYEGNQYSGLTQFALPSDTSFQDYDGAPSGELRKVNIDFEGNIVGIYSNGHSYTLAKLAISKFINPGGFERVGNSMFKLTPNVDKPNVLASNGYIGVANQGGRGSVLSAHLEMSNVNLTTEFTDLLMYQRSFQANSRGVLTADDILQTAIQLKR